MDFIRHTPCLFFLQKENLSIRKTIRQGLCRNLPNFGGMKKRFRQPEAFLGSVVIYGVINHQLEDAQKLALFWQRQLGQTLCQIGTVNGR